MKRCPECYESYGDQAKFCEIDGHELLADPALAPKAAAADVSTAKPVWWVGTAVGVLVGVIFGAGVFAVTFMVSTPRASERPDSNPTPEVQERVVPHRTVTASSSLPTPEPEASPSPNAEDQAQAAASPATTAENKTAAAQLNEGPISTGQKSTTGDSEAAAQTVIEMTDGSKLDVDAAWEDKQGIWYRRSGLVSFVESSRVKSITARRDTKVTDEPHH